MKRKLGGQNNGKEKKIGNISFCCYFNYSDVGCNYIYGDGKF